MKSTNVKKLIGIGLFSVTTLAFGADGREGHGGQGVVCKDANGKITSVEIADYYEGESTLGGTSLDTGPSSASYLDTVQFILDRYAKVDPVAAKRYLERAKTFEHETKFSRTPLTPIDDAHEPIQAKTGCEMAQFALQNYPIKPLQSRYIVDQAIWDGADSVAKAGLVLHEVIYTDALSLGQTTSDNARYFNYIISSTAIASMSSDDYIKILTASGFSVDLPGCLFSFFQDGIPFCENRVAEEYPLKLGDGQIVTLLPDRLSGFTDREQEGKLITQYNVSPVQIEIFGNRIRIKCVFLRPDLSVGAVCIDDKIQLSTPSGTYNFGGVLEFYPGGQIGFGQLMSESTATIGGVSVVVRGNIIFDKNGNIIEVSAQSTGPFSAVIRSKQVQFLSASKFFPNGQVQEGDVASNQTFTEVSGKEVHLSSEKIVNYLPIIEKHKSYHVTFDSNGYLLSY